MFILSALTPLFCSLALSFLYLYIYTYKHQRWNSKRFFTIDDSLSMTQYWLVIMSHNCWLMFKAVQSPFFQLLEYFCHFASWWNSLKLQSVARAAVPITPMTISKKNISWWSILIIYHILYMESGNLGPKESPGPVYPGSNGLFSTWPHQSTSQNSWV